MRIRRKTAALSQLLPEMMQVMLVGSSFQERTRIDAWCGMTLEINLVTHKVLGPGSKKMIKGDFIKRRRGSIGGNMAAQTAVSSVGIDDHGHRVPPRVTL